MGLNSSSPVCMDFEAPCWALAKSQRPLSSLWSWRGHGVGICIDLTLLVPSGGIELKFSSLHRFWSSMWALAKSQWPILIVAQFLSPSVFLVSFQFLIIYCSSAFMAQSRALFQESLLHFSFLFHNYPLFAYDIPCFVVLVSCHSFCADVSQAAFTRSANSPD